MIIVTMTLNSAITGLDTQLAKIHISNDGTGTVLRGNYNWTISGKGKFVLKYGQIYNWPRKSKTALALLQRVLNDAYPKAAK